MGVPNARDLEGQLREIYAQLDILQHRSIPIERSGSSARRDAIYGTPTTVAQRVALANQRPVWFNTETMTEETYCAVIGSSGLTGNGVYTAAGWYPIRMVFRATAIGGTPQTIQTGTWTQLSGALNATPQINDGFGWNASRELRIPRDGVYRLGVAVDFQSVGAQNRIGTGLSLNSTIGGSAADPVRLLGYAENGVAATNVTRLNQGDILRAYGYTEGSARTTGVNQFAPYVTAEWVHG